MKLRALLLLAAVVTLPTATLLAHPTIAAARGRGGEMVAQARGPRGNQQNLTPEERQAKRAEHHAAMAERMKQALGLSDEQASAMEAIRAKYQPQMEALRQEAKTLREGGASREEIKTALGDRREAIHDQMQGEMKTILSDEQIQKLEEMKQKRGERRGERRGRHGVGHRGEGQGEGRGGRRGGGQGVQPNAQ